MTLAADPARPGAAAPRLCPGVRDAGLEPDGIVVLAIAAVSARSVALAGFGLDSLIEMGAVHRGDLGAVRRRGAAPAAQPAAHRLRVRSPGRLPAGAVQRGAGHRVPPAALGARNHLDHNDRGRDVRAGSRARPAPAPRWAIPCCRTEGRVTLIDGILATAVLLGLVLNAALGWWWADPAAGYVLVFYAAREVRGHLHHKTLTAGTGGQVSETRDGKDASGWPQAHSCGVPYRGAGEVVDADPGQVALGGGDLLRAVAEQGQRDSPTGSASRGPFVQSPPCSKLSDPRTCPAANSRWLRRSATHSPAAPGRARVVVDMGLEHMGDPSPPRGGGRQPPGRYPAAGPPPGRLARRSPGNCGRPALRCRC